MPNHFSHRPARALLATIFFLSGFFCILLLVTYKYLLPAAAAASNADPQGRKRLAAVSLLVLAITLFTLFAMLILFFRPGRFLFPRKTDPRSRTFYTDAWKESANRMDPPPPEE